MHETTSREKILKRVRNAGLTSVDNRYSGVNQDAGIYVPAYDDDLLVTFAQELNNIGGSFVFCENRAEFISNFTVLMKSRKAASVFCVDDEIKGVLSGSGVAVDSDIQNRTSAPIIVTGCEALVARLGSIVVSSQSGSGRAANFLPEVHIVVAKPSQVVPAVKDAVDFLNARYGSLPSMVSFITGPSRTADIEKTLVMGAHGPRELIVFVVDNM